MRSEPMTMREQLPHLTQFVATQDRGTRGDELAKAFEGWWGPGSVFLIFILVGSSLQTILIVSSIGLVGWSVMVALRWRREAVEGERRLQLEALKGCLFVENDREPGPPQEVEGAGAGLRLLESAAADWYRIERVLERRSWNLPELEPMRAACQRAARTAMWDLVQSVGPSVIPLGGGRSFRHEPPVIPSDRCLASALAQLADEVEARAPDPQDRPGVQVLVEAARSLRHYRAAERELL
jgi:hypothetical protein